MKAVICVLACVVAFIAQAVPSGVPRTAEVVIVGAGLSGLATAYELKRAHVPFHVLELTPRIGGRVRTVKYEKNGETVYADSGMEEYWRSNPAVKILEELKLPTRVDTALSSIVLLNKLYPLGDEKPAEFRKRLFTAEENAALDKFKAEVAPLVEKLTSGKPVPADLLKLKDKSFAAWVAEKNLPKKVSEWLRISLECEIGTDWDRIAAPDGMAEFHIFLGQDGEEAVRVIGGNEKFTDALAQAVGRENISTNKAVKSVITRGDKVTVAYLDMATNVAGQVEAQHVVSTIPLFRLFEVQFDPPLSEKKSEAIRTMGWGSYFKAHVFVSPKAERFWTKDKASILPILSDSELGVIYEGNPDQKTKTRIVSLLVTGDNAEKYNLMPLQQVRDELKAAFEKLWPGFTKEIHEIEFYRYHPRAIAAWNPGRSRFDDLAVAVRTPENRVYLAGDFTESSHSDGAFLSAHRSVEQILAARKASTKGRAVSGK